MTTNPNNAWRNHASQAFSLIGFFFLGAGAFAARNNITWLLLGLLALTGAWFLKCQLTACPKCQQKILSADASFKHCPGCGTDLQSQQSRQDQASEAKSAPSTPSN